MQKSSAALEYAIIELVDRLILSGYNTIEKICVELQKAIGDENFHVGYCFEVPAIFCEFDDFEFTVKFYPRAEQR